MLIKAEEEDIRAKDIIRMRVAIFVFYSMVHAINSRF